MKDFCDDYGFFIKGLELENYFCGENKESKFRVLILEVRV